MGPLLALLITFGLMWALLILPQQRRMRKHQAVIASLEVGDEVVTAGGVYGTVMEVAEETLAVEVAPGVVLQVLRNAVTQRVAPAEPVEADAVDADPVEEGQASVAEQVDGEGPVDSGPDHEHRL